MNYNVLSNFYKVVGHRIFSSPSSEWCEIQRGMLISIPFHRLINPSEDELKELLKSSGAIGLRYPTDKNNYGFESSLMMCRTVGYDMRSLTSKARNQVRKGCNNFEIRDVSMRDLEHYGLQLNKKTLQRQKRSDPKSDKSYWGKVCMACYDVEGVKVIGSYLKDILVAYMIILETPTAIEIIIQNSDPKLLSLCPNNVLIYTVTNNYLNLSNDSIPLCYGLGALEETSLLDHFKINMGYKPEPIKQRLYFNSIVRHFINSYTYNSIELVRAHFFKNNYFIRKSSGIMRCYLSQF